MTDSTPRMFSSDLRRQLLHQSSAGIVGLAVEVEHAGRGGGAVMSSYQSQCHHTRFTRRTSRRCLFAPTQRTHRVRRNRHRCGCCECTDRAVHRISGCNYMYRSGGRGGGSPACRRFAGTSSCIDPQSGGLVSARSARSRHQSPTSSWQPPRWCVCGRRRRAILAEHTGRDVATLRHDTDRDSVLTASAALDYGIGRPGSEEPLSGKHADATRVRSWCARPAISAMDVPSAPTTF